MLQKEIAKLYKIAKDEGRICSRCGWIITKARFEKGITVCWDCEDALKGVFIYLEDRENHGPYLDEPIDFTGEE